MKQIWTWAKQVLVTLTQIVKLLKNLDAETKEAIKWCGVSLVYSEALCSIIATEGCTDYYQLMA